MTIVGIPLLLLLPFAILGIAVARAGRLHRRCVPPVGTIASHRLGLADPETRTLVN
jgi:hypothetical protein